MALKVLPPEAASADRLDRFGREARALAALNHPNIVTIDGVHAIDDVQFFTMELVRGVSLAEPRASGVRTAAQLLELTIPIAEALGAAHELPNYGFNARTNAPFRCRTTAAGAR
ncbi:MAG TPA: hypothetical protein VMO26_07770 [Vicinamibacterales bacterium]|nr:hypothetical protein [Vicinamibacterales bacterium]